MMIRTRHQTYMQHKQAAACLHVHAPPQEETLLIGMTLWLGAFTLEGPMLPGERNAQN